MLKHFCLGLLIYCWSISLIYGDYFAKAYGEIGYEYAYIVQKTNDGGFIIGGGTNSFGAGSYDVLILKLNDIGEIQWQKVYGGAAEDYAYSLKQTNDGGYIIAGKTKSFGVYSYDIWVLKLYNSGDIQWQRTYGSYDDEYANDIEQTSDGGFILAGVKSPYSGSLQDILILKLNNDGEIQWQKIYGGNAEDYAYSIKETTDGGFIIAGATSSYGAGNLDALIIKLDQSGTIQWQKTYGEINYERAFSIEKTTDGGYVIGGRTNSFGAASGDFWILKLNNSGGIQWQRTYGGSAFDTANFVKQTKDGGYIAIGWTNSYGNGFFDVMIIKLDVIGGIQWQKTYGGDEIDYGYYIVETDDGGFLAVAQTNSFGSGSYDIWILKIDSSGWITYTCSVIKNSEASITTSVAEIANSSISTSNSSQTINLTNINAIPSAALTSTQCFLGFCKLQPLNNQKPLVEDADSQNANNIFEPGETAELIATLENVGTNTASFVIGNLTTTDTSITINQQYSIYDNINPGSYKTCSLCYSLTPHSNRPSAHWDFTVYDNISAVSCGPYIFDYTYHVGNSFNDVQPSNAFYKYIETLLHSAVVAGCTENTYCPSNYIQRQSMAKFICLAMNQKLSGSCIPNGCNNIFEDVPYSNIFCSYIETLYNIGIISGCQSNPMKYCPDENVQRQAMAKFICSAMQISSTGSCPISACSGIFSDVPSSNPFCSYIEALYNANVITGCQNNPLYYCPNDNVSRQQMAKFIVNAFNLSL